MPVRRHRIGDQLPAVIHANPDPAAINVCRDPVAEANRSGCASGKYGPLQRHRVSRNNTCLTKGNEFKFNAATFDPLLKGFA